MLLRPNYNILSLINTDVCCNSFPCSYWLVLMEKTITLWENIPQWSFLDLDQIVAFVWHCTARQRWRDWDVGDVEEGCVILISGGTDQESETEEGGGAVIKQRAVGQAGSPVRLVSVCSVCCRPLPCGLFLKRRPTMDEACPLCAFVLCGGWVTGLSTPPQSPRSTAYSVL